MSDIGDKSEMIAEVFFRDGSLRDIYVLDCGLSDWVLAAKLLESDYALRFEGAWTGSRFPPSVASLFPSCAHSELTLLTVGAGELNLCCHFFSTEEIEFDLSPRDVTDNGKVEDILKFMRRLALATGKKVILTPENMRERPLLGVDPVHPQDIQEFWREGLP
jgi:hypothetical protein